MSNPNIFPTQPSLGDPPPCQQYTFKDKETAVQLQPPPERPRDELLTLTWLTGAAAQLTYRPPEDRVGTSLLLPQSHQHSAAAHSRPHSTSSRLHLLTTDMSSLDLALVTWPNYIQKGCQYYFYFVQLQSTCFGGWLRAFGPTHHDTAFGREICKPNPPSVAGFPEQNL